jgi:hypothetical protein
VCSAFAAAVVAIGFTLGALLDPTVAKAFAASAFTVVSPVPNASAS